MKAATPGSPFPHAVSKVGSRQRTLGDGVSVLVEGGGIYFSGWGSREYAPRVAMGVGLGCNRVGWTVCEQSRSLAQVARPGEWEAGRSAIQP